MKQRLLYRLWCLPLLLLSACGPRLEIRDRPISFSPLRHSATLRYIEDHYGLNPDDISITPQVIVLHWTAIAGFEASFEAFDAETLGSTRPDLGSSEQVNVSIHFLVDRDGAVYRLMPETWMARHVIGLNYSAVGIENVGGANSIDDLTDAQIAANIRLVRYLAQKYETIRFLIGHSEYRQFESHPLWLELDQSYRTEKVDPGERFMAAVRAGVTALDLQGPPAE